MQVFKSLLIKKSVIPIFILIFAVFNIYKCLQNNLTENISIHFHHFYQKSKLSSNKELHFNETREVQNLLSLEERLTIYCKPENASELKTKLVKVGNKTIELPIWQHLLGNKNNVSDKDEFDEIIVNYYFLVAVLQVRLYSQDKAKWSINELKQWFHFLFLAGVEHILVCDHYSNDKEKFETQIAKYINLQLVTYLPWNGIRNPMASQTKCYQKFIRQYKKYHMWHVAIDIDEYPFSPKDSGENFLIRYLQKIPEHISEISMDNYLMLGQGNRAENLVIKRITRMTKKPANHLTKPIYRPSRVLSAAVHHNHLHHGLSKPAPKDELRMLHYWGGRDQNWGSDTQKTIDITVEMNLMKTFWAQKLENSLITFGEYDAISNITGP